MINMNAEKQTKAGRQRDYLIMGDHDIPVPDEESFCSICNIWTNTRLIMQTHLVGKRHKQRLEKIENETDLISKSVYIFGYPTDRLSRADIDDFFTTNFSKVVSLTTNEPKSTWAIVEFDNKQIVKKILGSKTLEICGQKVRVKARKLKENSKLNTKENPYVKSFPVICNDEHGFLQPRPDSRTSTKSNSTCYSMLSDIDNCLNNSELIQFLKRPIDDFEKMRFLFDNCRITETDLKRRREIIKNITAYLAKYFKSKIGVVLYGSTLNGFGYKDSDVDMTFEIDDNSNDLDVQRRPIGMVLSAHLNDLTDAGAIDSKEFKEYLTSDQYQIIRKILLHHPNITDLNVVSGNRCPLLKFIYISPQDKAKYSCEFTLSNKFGVNNTGYLRFLVENFPNLALFGSLLRFLSHKCKLADHTVHSMNNYTLILMFITYLQTLGLVPIVETNSQDDAKFIGDWDCSWNDNFDRSAFNNDSINFSIFTQFLHFLTQIRWTNAVFCPRFGKILSVDQFLERKLDSSRRRRPLPSNKLDLNNNRSENDIFLLNNEAKTQTLKIFRFSTLNVQDPFVLSHNLAAKINPALIKRFTKVCWILCEKMNEKSSFFDCLLDSEANFAKVEDKNEERIPCYRKNHKIFDFELNVRPNQEDFNTFLEKWRFNFREKFQSTVFNNVKTIINRLLLIDLKNIDRDIVDQNQNGEEKSESFRCTAHAPTWTNRKVQLYQNVQSFVDIPESSKIRREIEISRLIMENFVRKSDEKIASDDDSRLENDEKIAIDDSSTKDHSKPLMIFDLLVESYCSTDNNDDYGVKIRLKSLSKDDEKLMNNMFKIFCLFFQAYYRKWRCYLASGDENE
uniref:RRM domain-containing protein n=1 Tax=Romanomermis culicivorax TaxID=13658 RepID=A0A915K586_ROMCU